MSKLATATGDCERLLGFLEATDCQYCEGELETGTYKGSEAILCEDCGTPTVRVW